jgi:predicted Zn-dependent peptidase
MHGRQRTRLVWRLVGAAVLVASVAVGAGLAGGGGEAAQEEPDLYRATLPNGLLVVTRERPRDQVAALAVYVRGGSRNEDPATVGSAHFMEHMFFQGTPLRPTSALIDAPVTERGGWVNASTGWEGISFFATVPNGAFDVALDVLSDILVNSTFEPVALEKERRVVVEELNRILNDPQSYAIETFAKTVFADHPVRQMPAGDRATVRSVSRDVLMQFRERFFRASNMVVAAVGNLRHEEVEAKITAAFAAMPTGAPPVWTPTAPPAAQQRVERRSIGARQSQIVLGWPTPGDDNPDHYTFEVLNAAMSSAGQRLASELRDRQGLVARVDSGYWALTDVGTWIVVATAEPGQTDAAVAGIVDQVRRLRDEPLSASALGEAQAYVRGSKRRGLERAIDQAQNLAEGISLGYYEPLDAYLAHIAAVSAADVQRVARTYLDPDSYTLVVLGP